MYPTDGNLCVFQQFSGPKSIPLKWLDRVPTHRRITHADLLTEKCGHYFLRRQSRTPTMAMTNTTVPLIRATVRAGDDGSGVSGAAVASSTMGWGVAVGDGVDVDGGAGATVGVGAGLDKRT